MHRSFAACLAMVLSLGLPALADDTPKRGGTLTYMIPADSPPSFDGHRENTFATIHAMAPFYSVLIRANPENPSDTTEFVCDVCTTIPESDRWWPDLRLPDPRRRQVSGRLGHDRLRRGGELERHRRSRRTGVISARRGYYSMIDKVEAPDAKTVVFHLKFATAAFLAGARQSLHLHLQEGHPRPRPRIGSRRTSWVPARSALRTIRPGNRSPASAIPITTAQDCPISMALSAFSPTSRRSGSRRSVGDRAAIEFRGFPPATRDELVAALGDQLTVQESDWNCGALITPNHQKKPFDDVRVRRALDAGDRPLAWRAGACRKITVEKTVGGVVFPGSPLAATKDELEQLGRLLAGYREVARRGEAVAEGGRRRGAELRIAQSQCRSALQVQWRLGSSTNGARSACTVDPERARHRPLHRRAAPRRFRGGDRRRLPEHRQSAARRHQVPAALGLADAISATTTTRWRSTSTTGCCGKPTSRGNAT